MEQVTLKNFFIPRTFSDTKTCSDIAAYAIIPSYKPHPEWTIRLILDLLWWNEKLLVYVVDDCTPKEYEDQYHVFENIQVLSSRVTVLRTPKNKMKAGAINYGLRYVFSKAKKPDVIFTFDDDVVVDKDTVRNLTKGLFADDRLGAVCSQCRVLNKNKNILTRLQGLEYLGFNAMRLADEGFVNGPLVMHGMLTAFRADVFLETGVFAENHLIEDYEITARIKSRGWHVRLVPSAYAWTEVPDTFLKLWDQRTRWIYGGLTVLFATRPKAIIQDVIGHGVFLSTLFLIFAFLFTHGTQEVVPRSILNLIIFFSVAQLVVWYVFQLWYMRFYQERDKIDWIIRFTLVPEFIYANVLSCVLLGAYAFHVFNFFCKRRFSKGRGATGMMVFIQKIFLKLGYTKFWGTR